MARKISRSTKRLLLFVAALPATLVITGSGEVGTRTLGLTATALETLSLPGGVAFDLDAFAIEALRDVALDVFGGGFHRSLSSGA